MKFAIQLPANRKPLTPQVFTSIPSASDRVHNVTIGDLLGLLHQGKLRHYEHNRGNADIERDLVGRIRADLHIDSLGTFWVDEDGVLRDGHNRLLALHQAWADGTLGRKRLERTVGLRVVPCGEALRVYRNVNSGEKHTSKDKLGNADMGFGRLLHCQILPLLDAEERGSLRPRHLHALAYVTYAKAALPAEDMSNYAKVVGQKGKVARLFNALPDEMPFTLSPQDIQAVVGAVRFYCRLMAQVQDLWQAECQKAGTLLGRNTRRRRIIQEQLRKVSLSAPLFGLVLCDQLCGTPRLTDGAVAATNSLSQLDTLTEELAAIQTKNRILEEKTETIIKLLVDGKAPRRRKRA